MAEFTQRPFGVLDGIYRFQGGLRGVNRLDLRSDITMVHDVSRQAEKAGIGGFYGNILYQNEVTINGQGADLLDRVTEIQPFIGKDDEDYELYALKFSCYVGTGDLNDIAELTVGISNEGTLERAILLGAGQKFYIPLANWIKTDAATMYQSPGFASTFAWVPDQPVRIPPASAAQFYYETIASAVLHWSWELWAGAAGSSPPGRS